MHVADAPRLCKSSCHTVLKKRQIHVPPPRSARPCLQVEAALDEAQAALQSNVDEAAGLRAALEAAQQRHAEQLRRWDTCLSAFKDTAISEARHRQVHTAGLQPWTCGENVEDAQCEQS